MNKKHEMTKVVLSSVLLIIALIEALFSAAAGVKTVGVTDATTYPLGTNDTLRCVDKVNELEKDIIDLPHTEVNKYHTLNDNALIGADGISMFNSLVNKDVTAYMEKFGICGWVASNRFTYQESSPFTNLMLNVKYIITPYGAYLDSTHNALVYQSGNVKLLQNKYYVPQGFMVKDDLLNFNPEVAPLLPMDNQNNMFRLATGLSGDLYEYLDCTSAKGSSDGASVNQDSKGVFSYSSQQNNDSYDIEYTVPRDGVATAYFSTGSSDSVSIFINGTEKISYYVKRPFIMMIGDVKQGDKISLHTSVSNSSSGSISAYCAMFNDELFTEGYNKLSQSALKATKITDTEIVGDITTNESGLFYTSISYTGGWKAYVDGVETPITPVGKALLAFHLDKGVHHIELKYTPEGFVLGLTCTVTAILIFVALLFIVPRRKKIFAKFIKAKSSESSETAEIPAEASAETDNGESEGGETDDSAADTEKSDKTEE